MKKIILTATAVALIAFASYAADVPQTPPAEGTAAPKFSLQSQEAATVSLDQFKGKWVVLYFYPKDFTSGCTLEAHNFQRDLAKYEQKNAVIVGVSLDTVDSHKSFCTKEGLNFKLLADTDHAVTTRIRLADGCTTAPRTSRNTFLIDPNGRHPQGLSEGETGHAQRRRAGRPGHPASEEITYETSRPDKVAAGGFSCPRSMVTRRVRRSNSAAAPRSGQRIAPGLPRSSRQQWSIPRRRRKPRNSENVGRTLQSDDRARSDLKVRTTL